MMYTGLHKQAEKYAYKDAKARLVHLVQNTQEVFDGRALISAHDFAERAFYE